MAAFNGVAAVGTIAQVTQKYLAGKTYVLLQVIDVFEGGRVFVVNGLELGIDLIEDVLGWVLLNGARARDVAISGLHVEFDIGNSGAVLAAVVLLFHQQMHFVEAPQGRSVFVEVVLQWFFEPQKGYATLVLNRITHGWEFAGKGNSLFVNLYGESLDNLLFNHPPTRLANWCAYPQTLL